MGPPQGFAADLRGIANSDLSLADKVRMTHDTIGYYYRNSPAFQGWVQAVGGGVEVLGGMALSSVPGGAVPGSVAIVHGVDNYAAGLNRFYDENAGRTLTYRLVHAATGSPWLADAVDRGIPFTTAVAGGATALGAAQAARPGANAAQWGRVNAGEEAANGAANSGAAAVDAPIGAVAKPSYVFRGDGRPPSKIFDEGFRASGTNSNLLNHTMSNNNSGLISTSLSPNVGREFAEMQVDGYVYTIRKPPQALDVNVTLGAKSPYPHELEVVIPQAIRSQDILGARQVGTGGKFSGPFIKNPKFK
ncbi:scabin-related ADP-ribosyltransferase [Ottowia testudinis]|uniref:Pierisin-like domain-containing protein n=1 Tax=Ottowia testudinis TaxID=2816950 RepID=A0A975H6I3_9BURK|nr:enterotoxin A family protein [Ottowia testudinis]QTD46037.1 hypothetical protein J1M35_03760 [Ottowia testudinis]